MDPNVVITQPTVLSGSAPSVSASQSMSALPTMSASPSAPTVKSGGKWKKVLLYIAVIVVLAILGLNIFRYLGKATDTVSDIFKPITALFGKGVTKTVKKTVDVGAKGTKGIINTTTNVIDSGLNTLEKKLDGDKIRNKIDDRKKKKVNNDLGKAVKPHKKKPKKGPEPDDAGSKTQMQSKGKAGFCYIGEDRGFRSCIKVGEEDKCMSGEIFPTKELCINPNLRE